jgi:hypothetical protein
MKHFLLIFISFCFLFACSSKDEEVKTPEKPTSKTTSKASKKWKGKWEREVWGNQATLEITKIKGNKLTFRIFAIAGANIGELKGTAKAKGKKASFKDGTNCTLEFTLTDDYIEVAQKEGDCGSGNGVTYAGKYKHEKFSSDEEMTTDLAELKILSQEEDIIFRELVENKYNAFVNSAQSTKKCNDLDNFQAKVTCNHIPGLNGVMESIIMVDKNHSIWAAVLEEGKVYYFTTDSNFKDKLPNTIDQWREKFKDNKIVYQ